MYWGNLRPPSTNCDCDTPISVIVPLLPSARCRSKRDILLLICPKVYESEVVTLFPKRDRFFNFSIILKLNNHSF